MAALVVAPGRALSDVRELLFCGKSRQLFRRQRGGGRRDRPGAYSQAHARHAPDDGYARRARAELLHASGAWASVGVAATRISRAEARRRVRVDERRGLGRSSDRNRGPAVALGRPAGDTGRTDGQCAGGRGDSRDPVHGGDAAFGESARGAVDGDCGGRRDAGDVRGDPFLSARAVGIDAINRVLVFWRIGIRKTRSRSAARGTGSRGGHNDAPERRSRCGRPMAVWRGGGVETRSGFARSLAASDTSKRYRRRRSRRKHSRLSLLCGKPTADGRWRRRR